MANETKLANLVNPEVMADLIREKMVDLIKFSPLAKIDTTLAGRPGDTITLPKYSYIGDAVDVVEGGDIPVTVLTASTGSATVKKAAKGIVISDEAIVSGYGDPISEGTSQLGTAIAQKIDNDCLAALKTVAAAMTSDVSTVSVLSSDVIADALIKFGEDLDEDKVILVAPSQLAQLRKDPDYINGSEISTKILIEGAVGMIWGCQIVVSNKIKTETGKITNFIVKPGALAIYLKRDVLVETARDITKKTTIVTADEHYTTYLLDASKAIKLIVKSA